MVSEIWYSGNNSHLITNNAIFPPVFQKKIESVKSSIIVNKVIVTPKGRCQKKCTL